MLSAPGPDVGSGRGARPGGTRLLARCAPRRPLSITLVRQRAWSLGAEGGWEGAYGQRGQACKVLPRVKWMGQAVGGGPAASLARLPLPAAPCPRDGGSWTATLQGVCGCSRRPGHAKYPSTLARALRRPCVRKHAKPTQARPCSLWGHVRGPCLVGPPSLTVPQACLTCRQAPRTHPEHRTLDPWGA